MLPRAQATNSMLEVGDVVVGIPTSTQYRREKVWLMRSQFSSVLLCSIKELFQYMKVLFTLQNEASQKQKAAAANRGLQ